MSEQPDYTLPDEIIETLQVVFSAPKADSAFVDRLSRQLSDQVEQFTTPQRKIQIPVSPLAWGAVAVILVLSLVWGIKTLLPRSEPGINSQPSPSPLVGPTQAEGAEGIINLPTLVGTTVPLAEEPIPRMNAVQVTKLAAWKVIGPDSQVLSIEFSPDGRLVAFGLRSGQIKIFEAADGQELRTMSMTGNEFGVISLAFSPDGSLLASGGYASTSLWDVATGSELLKIEGATEGGWAAGGVPSVDFSPDGKLLAIAGPKGQVRLWDTTGQVELQPLVAQVSSSPGDAVAGVEFSPDGKILASGYSDHGFGSPAWNAITLWDPMTGRKLYTLGDYSNKAIPNVSSLEFSPDGKTLAAGYWDTKITLWDVANGSELYTISYPWHDEISSLSFSQSGDVLAVGCEFGSIKLVDPGNGKELATLPSGESGAYALAFSPDGKLLLSSSIDGLVNVWGIAPQGLTPSEAIPAPVEVGTGSISTPAPQVTPVELGMEKIPIPILLTGDNLQPISFSPHNSYLLYSQRGPIGEPGPNLAYSTLNFLDNISGETCQGIRETITFTQTEWGAYPEGIDINKRTTWIDDDRLLYINPGGGLSAITRCDDSVKNLGDGIPDRLLSLGGRSTKDDWQIVIKGEQAFWLFAPSTGQAVKIDIPVPPAGQDVQVGWSPWDDQLLSSRIDLRSDGLWIVIEEINPASGAASPIYEAKASEDLYNVEPKIPSFEWLAQDLIILDYVGSGMGLVDLNSQPPGFTDLFSGVPGIEALPRYELSAWGAMPNIAVQGDRHLILETGFASDGQIYLYHPESGMVDKYPLNPPFMIVYPGGGGGIVQSFTEDAPPDDIYKVVFVDRDLEPNELVVKGHLPRSGSSLTADVLPGAEQVLFSSDRGISLVSLMSGETMKFWEFENKELYQSFFTWISPDGKTVLSFATGQDPEGGAMTQAIYWLRLEP